MEFEQGGDAHNDSQATQAMRPDEQGPNSQQRAICCGEIGGSFAITARNHELVFEEQRFGDHSGSATWPQKLGDGDEQVEEKNGNDLHAR